MIIEVLPPSSLRTLVCLKAAGMLSVACGTNWCELQGRRSCLSSKRRAGGFKMQTTSGSHSVAKMRFHCVVNDARVPRRAQVVITLDVEDESIASFWKEFNPEAWATVEAAGMKSIAQCAAQITFSGSCAAGFSIAAR